MPSLPGSNAQLQIHGHVVALVKFRGLKAKVEVNMKKRDLWRRVGINRGGREIRESGLKVVSCVCVKLSKNRLNQ